MSTHRGCTRLLVALAALAALRCSWDAPRDNPLDPMLGGNVSGRVLTRRATPIAAAVVAVPDAGRVVKTDSTGSFELRGLPEASAWVYLTAAGYASDSVLVALANGRIDTLTTYLNGLPFLQNCRVTTHVYGRGWPPEPLEFCRLSATAGDADGDADLDSVWAEIPAIGYAERLDYDPDSQAFVQTLYAADLPGQSMETLVGREVRFNVMDEEGTATTDTVAGITRIMTDLPEPVFPSGGQDTLSSDTVFIWYRFDHGYAVSYHSEVVRVEGGSPAGIAAEFDAADTTYHLASASLDSGDYYWTVEAIDEFGNSSRSAEELFHVR
ncbi:MAG: carboxypeptidase regulatory-like domain-containing protein [candidate division WOR-3 bacterium]|nr:carboxypeptidase regulatory-like domain-containing protein [candidate division WOR-3 bacterium]